MKDGPHDAIRVHRKSAGFSTPLTLAIAGGVCAVIVVVGSLIVINQKDGPEPDNAAPRTGNNDQGALPQDPTQTPAPAFGPALDIQTDDGFRYRIQATKLAWQSETSSGLAPPGEGFPTITIRSSNLLTEQAAPDPLIGESASAGLLFPESSNSSVGNGCPTGLPVLDVAARGRPIGRCFAPVVVDTTHTAAANVTNAPLEPGVTRDLTLTSETAIPTSRALSDIMFWGEFTGTSGFVQVPTP